MRRRSKLIVSGAVLKEMKSKKWLHLILAATMLFSACTLFGCEKKQVDSSVDVDEEKLNIIDDNYRNWYEVFVRSYYDSNNDGIGDLKGIKRQNIKMS